MWYEALPSFAIIVAAITVSGVGMRYIDRLFYEGKPKRYHVDEFDQRMIDRDASITGSKYKQKMCCTSVYKAGSGCARIGYLVCNYLAKCSEQGGHTQYKNNSKYALIQ